VTDETVLGPGKLYRRGEDGQWHLLGDFTVLEMRIALAQDGEVVIAPPSGRVKVSMTLAIDEATSWPPRDRRYAIARPPRKQAQWKRERNPWTRR
jgi:hypothetical protein